MIFEIPVMEKPSILCSMFTIYITVSRFMTYSRDATPKTIPKPKAELLQSLIVTIDGVWNHTECFTQKHSTLPDAGFETANMQANMKQSGYVYY